MTRTKRFGTQIVVSRELLATANFDVPEMVRSQLTDRLSGQLRGPRGGAYAPVGTITFDAGASDGDDFMRNTTTYRATRVARYTRPVR